MYGDAPGPFLQRIFLGLQERKESVLVSAHTSAGKTAVAEYVHPSIFRSTTFTCNVPLVADRLLGVLDLIGNIVIGNIERSVYCSVFDSKRPVTGNKLRWH